MPRDFTRPILPARPGVYTEGQPLLYHCLEAVKFAGVFVGFLPPAVARTADLLDVEHHTLFGSMLGFRYTLPLPSVVVCTANELLILISCLTLPPEHTYNMGRPCCRQVIALIAHLRSKGVNGPFLVTAPLATLPNWVKEFQKWLPAVDVILYHGSKDHR